ncbi:MAG: transposase [Colwellia sp.]|nr:transposase [Colwellia sp.]
MSYYAWVYRPAKIISESELMLYRRTKALFRESRQSLGSRQLMKKLRKQGFEVGRDKVIRLMDKLGLQVKQHIAYKVTAIVLPIISLTRILTPNSGEQQLVLNVEERNSIMINCTGSIYQEIYS